MDFDGTVVVVAGGASGIGRAAALAFAARGAQVVVGDVDEKGAAGTLSLAEDAPKPATFHGCDVTDPDACGELVQACVRAHGRLDVLVNAVGWTRISKFTDEDADYWRRLVDINLMSCLYLSRAALGVMSEQGHGAIVLTSSDAGRVGTSGETVYSATKAGVIGFVKSLAREVARHGVRVNAVAPGPTRTPLLVAQGGDELAEKILAGIPMRRLGEPEEPAEAIVFLASTHASYITGQTLSVSGGLTMAS